MKRVRLTAKDLDGNLVDDNVGGEFTSEDLVIFELFIRLMSRVRSCFLLERGMPAVSNVGFNGDSGLTLTCAPYTNAELYELLHVLRPVILKNEPASFYNVSALLGRRFKNKKVSSHMKYLRRVFENGELSLYMQITIGGQPLFDDSFLRLWLNAEQYHTDADKAAAWKGLEASLREENVRALVMGQLRGKVAALFDLERIVSLVTDQQVSDC